MAKIQLNGKKVAIKPNYSILDLLKKYKLSNKKVAIEHKRKFLKNNDRVEVVTFIGGG